MGIIVEFALAFVMEVIMYGIGRGTIAVLSLGHARAERFNEMIGKDHRSHDTAGMQLVVPVPATQIIGVAVFTAAIRFLVVLHH